MYTRPDQMTPFLPPRDETLTGLALDLIERSAYLDGLLHPITRRSLVEYLKLTNSYYSNLIENHHTHPVDIEKAMSKDYSREPAKRGRQIEGLAHVEVQSLIENKTADETTAICHPDFIRWIHREFYDRLPEEMRVITDTEQDETAKVVPGEYRLRPVVVGRHLPPSWESIPVFMEKFFHRYEPNRFKNTMERILAAAASHHRLSWIHPFLDGNGRVARLLTDVYLQRSKLRGIDLWTVSRGFARHRDRYMALIAGADAPRRGDLDGRGNLSQSGLVQFCRFFLETCTDQIGFMDRMLDLGGLIERMTGYVALRWQKMVPGYRPLKPEAGHLLREALLRGAFPRGEAARVTGLPERTARALVARMTDEHLLFSATPKGPLQLGFPSHAVEFYFPEMVPSYRANDSISPE